MTTVRHILLDDDDPAHRDLPIFRAGQVGMVRLTDTSYTVYATLAVPAHDLAALFHYGIIEALNTLPFISETNNGLDSWDEAFLPCAVIGRFIGILGECMRRIDPDKPQRVLVGWQDDPERIAYWREISPERTLDFLRRLEDFAAKAAAGGYDLECIL
jgi:hypothetical protein